jgi:hypothetical protein
MKIYNPEVSGSLRGAILSDYEEQSVFPTIESNSLSLDLSVGNFFDVQLNNTISSLSILNPPQTGSASSFALQLTGDGTSRAVSWGSAVTWSGGTPPTVTSTSGKKDIFVFVSNNSGSNWYGFISGQNL